MSSDEKERPQPKTTSSKSKPKSEMARNEEKTLAFWEERDIFAKTVDKDSPQGEFVFFEGPPTANGHPGIHHLESRAFKDAIPRFRTMQGYHVRRKAGWDTHGLPVELEVEKELGFDSKDDIEEYGIGKFNEACKENVGKYVDEWKEFTHRMGYWLDFDNDYVTYRPNYMETVWWIFSQIADRDLLYKSYKVVPWCPRCGTVLSSHELAQGYQTDKDLSVTAKFKLTTERDESDTIAEFEIGDQDVFFLAWTTTPWTLPGNIALAVSEDIEYVAVKVSDPEPPTTEEGEVYILAADLVEEVFSENDVETITSFPGTELVGRSYEPLYSYLKDTIPQGDSESMDKVYRVHSADFVTTEDGTGIVHTAVMYGQDDFELGKRVGLPMHHLVNDAGRFIEGTDFLEGRFVSEEDTAVEIIKDLYHRGLLFSKHKYEHEYPHCWRCDTKLIYYARDSWFIRMEELRDELVKNNDSINWEPEHIKEGRFGEWLNGAKDWAISRERYWGTPLPIWESEDGEIREVVGSIEDLKKKTKSSNSFYIMRHGESVHNTKRIVSASMDDSNSLTDKGKEQVKAQIDALKEANISHIYTSPLQRTKETAHMIADMLDLEDDAVVEDQRLSENGFGDFEGASIEEYHAAYESYHDRLVSSPKGAETWQAVKKRATEALYEINAKHNNEGILIISHNGTLEMLQCGARGLDNKKSAVALSDEDGIGLANGELLVLDFSPLPHNENFELDLHRPYIDDVTWENDDGQKMSRVPEVMDVWFDSGAMPLAQDHYPFENKERLDGAGYPADYISEAIDQTRGWFYTLHAISTLLGRGPAYKNVICLGHIMAADGTKMSKSRGNAVDPFEAMDEYGADVVRFWMYSVNNPGESKDFDRRTVDEVNKKVFNLLKNVVRFYEMFTADEVEPTSVDPCKSSHVLDQWILLKLNELISDMTSGLENYDLITPTRRLRDFIGDLSRWYIRRSRDRFKSNDAEDKQYAVATTHHVLLTVSKLLAPFAPFTAEDVYQTLKNESEDRESVHLEDWPEKNAQYKVKNKNLLENMEEVRSIVSAALDVRAQEGIKVRQPLETVHVQEGGSKLKSQKQLVELIRDEINVKEVVFDKNIDELVELDTEITPKLAREGLIRELIRQAQRLRKRSGLNPDDPIVLQVDTSDEGEDLIGEYEDDITDTVGATEIEFIDDIEDGEIVEEVGLKFAIKIAA